MVASEEFDLDSVFSELGQLGRYQLVTYILICIPMMFNAISTISYVFTAGNVDYRCKIPECDTESSGYLEPFLNWTVPFVDGVPEACKRYSVVTVNETFETDLCPSEWFNSSAVESCHDLIFKPNEWTISNEWDITCPENEWYLAMVGSANSIGQFVGMPLGGFVSDRYGRRFALVVGATLSALMGTLRSFSTSYSMFVTFEFLDAALGSVVYAAAFIVGVELVGPEKRVLGSTVLSAFYPVGEILLGVTAMYVRNWRTFLRVLYIPAFIHILYFWLTPESVRWLLSQGKTEEAIKVLRRAAKCNNTTISESSLVRLNQCCKESPSLEKLKPAKDRYPILTAFKSPRMFWRIVNCSFCWLTNTFVYYGLSLNSVALAGDKYMNFILVSAVEIPAFLIIYFVLEKIGRRMSQSGSLIFSGIACLAAIFVDSATPWVGLALFLLGKLAITVSFTVLYVYTTELFPTNIRHSLLSFCSMFGRIGSIVAPQTPLMAQYYVHLPLILFGGCAISSGLLCLLFPETLNTKLPDTILEAETIGLEKKKNPS